MRQEARLRQSMSGLADLGEVGKDSVAMGTEFFTTMRDNLMQVIESAKHD